MDYDDMRWEGDRGKGLREMDREEEQETIDSLQALLAIERQRADYLKLAVDSARRIGIAVGLLMAHHHVDTDEAFAILHIASRQTGRTLADLAELVISTGHLA